MKYFRYLALTAVAAIVVLFPTSAFAQNFGVRINGSLLLEVETTSGGGASCTPPVGQCIVQTIAIPQVGFLQSAPQIFPFNNSITVPPNGPATLNLTATANFGKLQVQSTESSLSEAADGSAQSGATVEPSWFDTLTIISNTPSLHPGDPVKLIITAELDSSVIESLPSILGKLGVGGSASYSLSLTNGQGIALLSNFIVGSGTGPNPKQVFQQQVDGFIGEQWPFIASLQGGATTQASMIGFKPPFPSSTGSVNATATFHFDICTPGATYKTASGMTYSSPSTASPCGTTPCTNVSAPTVQLQTNPASAEMREPYTLSAHVSNTDANCKVNFVLEWGEHYSFPKLIEPEQGGTTGSQVLEPGASVDLPLKMYTHTWHWLGPNPVSSIEDSLTSYRDGILIELLKCAWPFADTTKKDCPSLSGDFLTGLTKLIGQLNDASKFIPDAKSTTVTYTARVLYGPVGSLDFSAPVPSTQIELTAPLSKIIELASSLGWFLGGGKATDLGVAAILAPGGQAAALDFFVSQILLLQASRLAYNVAADPPDSDFTSLAVPTPIEFPELNTQGLNVWKELALSAQAFEALQAAEATSDNRALGASIAGSPTWESRQLQNAAGFAEESSLEMTRFVSLLQILEPFIQKNLQPHAQEAITYLQSQGLPGIEVSHLTQLGWTTDDLALVTQGLVSLGPGLTQQPSAPLFALQTGALGSAGNVVLYDQKSVQINVDVLGQGTLDVNQGALQALDSARTAIQIELGSGVPSSTLRAQIKTFLDDVQLLMVETNNLSVLSPYLNFGLTANADFQGLDVSIGGLKNFVAKLVSTGKIVDPGIANSLNAKLNAAESKVGEGDFETADNILVAFTNEVAAQTGKAISQDFADSLQGYAALLQELIAPVSSASM